LAGARAAFLAATSAAQAGCNMDHEENWTLCYVDHGDSYSLWICSPKNNGGVIALFHREPWRRPLAPVTRLRSEEPM
jgi:hypothetical protein